ncbi:ketoacyl-ACP synthase III family protein [Streptomyces mirabilis]|uniref:ketoacyl-ACP synthase III family protein n=1 Tax=Streptomyces mirabilis TaxID=68239 RepID=UPI003333EB73
MRDVYLAGVASVLPPAAPVSEAVAAGTYSAKAAAATQQLSVTVASAEQHSPDLAVSAARRALRQVRQSPPPISLVLHSMVLAPAGPLWHGAAYIHRELGIPAGRCIASDINSGCDSSLVSLELASAYLQTRGGDEFALVTAGECWRDPGVDRWSTATCPLGDGAAAAILSTQGGFARIAGAASFSDPELEPVSRGRNPFAADTGTPPGNDHDTSAEPLRLRSRSGKVMETERLWAAMNNDVRGVVAEALGQAGIGMSEIDYAVCPFLGHDQVVKEFLEPLSLELKATPWEFARRVGHLGAADPLAGLNHLVNTEGVRWRHILLLGAGLGGIFSAMVLANSKI